MIDSFLNSPTTALLERTLNFTEQRHKLILQNIANATTPGYIQQDASPAEFQKSLADALQRQAAGANASFDPEDTSTISFAGQSVQLKPQPAAEAQPFHDGGARSMEDLMGQLADNAEAHNMAASFLKSRYDLVQRAISMRV